MEHQKLDKDQNLDSPTFYEAIHGPRAPEYREAMRVEIEALENQNTWISSLVPTNQRVIKCTWVFKPKRLPGGTPFVTKPGFVLVGR